MKRAMAAFAVLALCLSAWGADPKVANPFETSGAFKPANAIDKVVLSGLKRKGIRPAKPCTDEVFVRRVYLDVIGTLPEPAEVLSFLRDRRRGKRSTLIETLLDRPEFADYWALKWGDLLRVKAEFPINLWPNAVQAYHRWIRDAVRENRPYDEFARALLTASGSNFRVPPVNFSRAVQNRTPAGLAQAAALTFMGSRIETWPEDRRAGLETFFSRVAYKKTDEWKEEIVFLSPAPAGMIETVFPDGTTARIASDEDPREIFADWLVSRENPWFAKAIVNRVWAWFLGRGIVHEPDDIRPDNEPSNPALLVLLSRELVGADYDLRHLFRLILESATYQQSSIPRSDRPETEALFGHYVVRPLGAEVLIDALCRITGSTEKYMSAIPEPFTNVPEEERSISLADGSITSPFLEMFGRPARDSGLESERNMNPTDGQRLHMLNSTDIQRRIDQSNRLRGFFRRSRGKPGEVIVGLYLTILSRRPNKEETEVATKYLRTGGARAAGDLAWALLNTKEFLYRH